MSLDVNDVPSDTSLVTSPAEDKLGVAENLALAGVMTFLVGMLLLCIYAALYPLFSISVPSIVFQITAFIGEGAGIMAMLMFNFASSRNPRT